MLSPEKVLRGLIISKHMYMKLYNSIIYLKICRIYLSLNEETRQGGGSLINIKKRVGPRTVPCGTQDNICLMPVLAIC